MKPIRALIALLIVSCLFAVPALAVNVEPGSHYTNLPADTGVVKYADPPLSEIEQISGTTGSIAIGVETGGCLAEWFQSVTVAAYNGSYVQHVDIGPEGKADIRVPANTYAVCYATDHGSGYDPSTWRMTCQDVPVSAGQSAQVTFIGPGSTCTANAPEASCQIKVELAQYGAITCNEECHDEIDVPAHDEYRVRGYWEVIWTPWGPFRQWHHVSFWGPWSDEQYSHWNEIPFGDKQVQHVSATYHEVCEEVCSGSYADVTSEVQEVVNTGHKSFLFDNSKNPGGIFDVSGETLLAAIADPAPGQVKSAMIQYSRCNVQNTVTAQEYEVITL